MKTQCANLLSFMKFRAIISIVRMLSIDRVRGSFNLNKLRNSWTTKIYDAAILARPYWAEPVPVRVCYHFSARMRSQTFLGYASARVGWPGKQKLQPIL